MKKLVVGVLLAAFLCMLAWCGSSRPADGSPWTENDFVPYDKNGGPIAVEGSQWALLSYDQAQTARGVTEGMTAKEAVAKYDFSDATWELYIKDRKEDSEAALEEYTQKFQTLTEVAEAAPELEEKGLGVLVYLTVYEKDGQLCTASALGIEPGDLSEGKEYEKYSLIFTIREGKICAWQVVFKNQ